jgi:hypothetical protein
VLQKNYLMKRMGQAMAKIMNKNQPDLGLFKDNL